MEGEVRNLKNRVQGQQSIYICGTPKFCPSHNVEDKTGPQKSNMGTYLDLVPDLNWEYMVIHKFSYADI